jgi:hypothetical protein
MTGQQLQEGGFACAVTAQEADPFAGLDLKRNAIQQRWAAKIHRNIIDE